MIAQLVFLLTHAAWWTITAFLLAHHIGWWWTGAAFTATVLVVYLSVAVAERGKS